MSISFPPDQPEVSIIIPAYNSERYIERCLDAIMGSSYPACEIIVVDDCSTDGTVEKAREKGAVILHSPQQSGPAFTRNLGAKHTKGEILLFIDSDIIVKEDTIKQVLSNFLHFPEIAALFGSYDDDPEERNFVSQYKNLFHHYHHQHAQRNAITFWAGCGAIRKNIFEELGGFDQTQYCKPSIEDIELGYRLHKKGYQILLDKSLTVKHLKRWDFLSMLRTDIFQRAIPWSQLIVETKFMPKDLNLSVSHKISSISIFLLLLTSPFAFLGYTKLYELLTIMLLINLIILNRSLYVFFVRNRGILFAIKAIPFHLLYYLYSGLSFALCWLIHKAFNYIPFANKSEA
ncbi:MAG: glycosyltransferase [Nitrospinota bacterium]